MTYVRSTGPTWRLWEDIPPAERLTMDDVLQIERTLSLSPDERHYLRAALARQVRCPYAVVARHMLLPRYVPCRGGTAAGEPCRRHRDA